MSTERIEVLKSILLDLHNGASAESVQELFNEHFAGVSAIEISLMEHELMNSDTGVTFEDVMSLCNVHANLFKGAIQNVEVADTDHPGHPVQVFKQENLALRAALMRVRRLLSTYETTEDEDLLPEIRKGLQRQLSLVGQFDIHYQRKEELMFPIMENYGHDSPPKVMWGVDDQIRDLFQEAKIAAEQLPDTSIEEVKEGAVVALADNPANTTRALRLLESAGLIKLKPDFDDGVGTPDDVIENPKKLEFKLIDDTTAVRVLDDVDLSIIGNTIALEGGLNVLKDAIYKEEINDSTKSRINVIAVKKGREKDENLLKLVELYHTPKVQEFIKEKFEGTKVEVKKDIKDVWKEAE